MPKKTFVMYTYPEDPALREAGGVVYCTQAFWLIPAEGKISGLNLSGKKLIQDYLQRNISFVRNLDYSYYEIRYVNKMGRAGEPEVSLCLLIKTAATENLGEDIKELQEKSVRRLKKLFARYFPDYRLFPMETEPEFKNVLRPFEFNYFCNIKRRHGVARIGNPERTYFIKPENKYLKKLKKLPIREIDLSCSDEYFYFVCPFVYKNVKFENIAKMLMNSGQNLMFSVEIGRTMAFKKNLFRPAIVAYKTFKKFIEQSYGRKKTVSEIRQIVKTYNRMLDEKDRLYEMNIVLASDRKIKRSTVNEIAGHISPPVKNSMFRGGYDLNCFRPEKTLSSDERLFCFKPDDGDKLFMYCNDWRNIFTAEEAVSAFKIQPASFLLRSKNNKLLFK